MPPPLHTLTQHHPPVFTVHTYIPLHIHTQSTTLHTPPYSLHIEGGDVIDVAVPDCVPEVGDVLLHLLRDGVGGVMAALPVVPLPSHRVVVVLSILQRVALVLPGEREVRVVVRVR